MAKNKWHSKFCKWDGESMDFSLPGVCVGCDGIRNGRITKNAFKGKYGMGKSELISFCTSGIKWAKCTIHTNPSCACGKLVLNATA